MGESIRFFSPIRLLIFIIVMTKIPICIGVYTMEVWGPPNMRFRLKLKGIRDRLRIWNREVFESIARRKDMCLDGIQKWDNKEEFFSLLVG